MKQILSLTLLLFVMLSGIAQEECKVLLPEIEGEYVGECKKGLANGNGKSVGTDSYEGQFKKGWPNGIGIYTWESGDWYEGEFRKGKLDGEGAMHIISGGEDTLVTGIWIENNYAGPKIKEPRVIQKINIDDGRFKRNSDGNRLIIAIYKNGTYNYDLEQFVIAQSSGGRYKMGQKFVLDNVIFPFECKITYITWNKLHTAQYHAIFQFKIEQAGDWSLDLNN